MRCVVAADCGKVPVFPFDLSLPSAFAYYLVCPSATAQRPKIRAFWEWVREETAADR